MTWWPARSSWRRSRTATPGSSSTMRMRACVGSIMDWPFCGPPASRGGGIARQVDDLQEQPEPADGLEERLALHRLGDVDVAAQFVTAFDLARVVGRREHDHHQPLRDGVGAEAPQYLDAVQPRHLHVQ